MTNFQDIFKPYLFNGLFKAYYDGATFLCRIFCGHLQYFNGEGRWVDFEANFLHALLDDGVLLAPNSFYPKKGEWYYTYTNDFEVDEFIYSGTFEEKCKVMTGVVYKTKQYAILAKEYTKAVFEDMEELHG